MLGSGPNLRRWLIGGAEEPEVEWKRKGSIATKLDNPAPSELIIKICWKCGPLLMKKQ